MLKRSFIIWTLILLGVASGCKKNKRPYFPNIGFEQYIYLNNPSNTALQHPGGWVYHNGGYRGLIVYRRYIQHTSRDFAVYDRGCPTHYDEDCGELEVTEDDLYVRCPCGGEKYLLLDGSPSNEAHYPLVPYRAQLNGNVLYVAN